MDALENESGSGDVRGEFEGESARGLRVAEPVSNELAAPEARLALRFQELLHAPIKYAATRALRALRDEEQAFEYLSDRLTPRIVALVGDWVDEVMIGNQLPPAPQAFAAPSSEPAPESEPVPLTRTIRPPRQVATPASPAPPTRPVRRSRSAGRVVPVPLVTRSGPVRSTARIDSPSPAFPCVEKSSAVALRPSRRSGDAMIAELFERLHDLSFVADVRQGAAFVLRTVADSLHARAGIVHLYDINHAEFLVVDAIGSNAAGLANWSTKENDSLIEQAIGSEDSIVVLNAREQLELRTGRWSLLAPRLWVVCAAVQDEGRLLALLELSDPSDDCEFTEEDRNGVAYACRALCRFIRERGLVLSEPPRHA